MRNASSRYVDKMGRSLAPGRSRTAENANVRYRAKGVKPLPLHLACHAPKAKRTYTERNPVRTTHPYLQELSLRTLLGRLQPGKLRATVPFQIHHKTRGYLGWTGDERLMRTICQKAEGTVYVTRG